MRLPACVALLASSLFAAFPSRAQSLIPPEPVTLKDLRPLTPNWRPAGGVQGRLRQDKEIGALPGEGVLVNNPVKDVPNQDLATQWEHGDLDLELDFLFTPKSNSGVYFQGRYELQLFESWGAKAPKHSDAGGIYERWDEARGKGKEGYEGHAPKANASRAPGLWQHLSVQFRAPRFDASGRKTANARFVKVVLNGHVVQENVEVTGPTRGADFTDEKPAGPLVIQGDHGPVALRNFAVKRYGDRQLAVKDLKFKYHGGQRLNLDTYADAKVTREADLQHFSGAVQAADGRGVAVFTGTLEVPVDGEYGFRADVPGPARLSIDGAVVVYPGINSPQAGTVSLKAGNHALKVEQQHQGSWALRDGGLKVWAEAPGIAPHQLAPAGPLAAGRAQVSIPVEPKDRVLLQRTFIPLERSRRLYACFVGTPAGVHYAYDLEQACVVGVWRGGFFEGRDLWHERAFDQQAHATGPAMWIEGKPLLFQFGDNDARWPDRAPPTSASRGYRLEANGQPVFLYEFSGVQAEDRIAPLADGSGLTRTLKFTGKARERDIWALLAEGSQIVPQPEGAGYVIGDRGFYLDWPKDSPVKPVLRREGDRVQLLVRLTESARELTYNLVW